MHKTLEAIAYAKLLRSQGLNYAEIGRRLEISCGLAHIWVDDEYAARRRARNNEQRRGKTSAHVLPKIERGSETDYRRPTLVHIPGVEIGGRYCTAPSRLKRISAPHGHLKKPRELFVSTREARLVHLGRGKVMME